MIINHIYNLEMKIKLQINYQFDKCAVNSESLEPYN